MRRLTAPLLLLTAFAVSACEDEDDIAETKERVRAIKTFTVTQPVGGQTRAFSGSLAAAATSSLSFSVGGTTTKVNVSAGDTVKAGELLAELDPEPLTLDVDAARSNLASAQASFDEKQANVDRQRTLFEKGWLAQAGLDQALAAFEVAEGEVNVARSKLAAAERDLEKAKLTAPFDGVIASRDVEPFQEVSAGQSLFQINANGAMEVDLAVPAARVLNVDVRIDRSIWRGDGHDGGEI